jgi:hypothetical protein
MKYPYFHMRSTARAHPVSGLPGKVQALRVSNHFKVLALGVSLTLSTLCFADPAVSERTTVDRELFAYAVTLYRSAQFSAAYGRFRAMANQGDMESASIALFMLSNGERLYGTKWSTTPSESSRWLALVGGIHRFENYVSND